MRKFYEEYFYVPKHGKIREKVMLARVSLTVVTMVLCLIAMSITAYAYFSHEASSGSHIIKSANFTIKVGVDVRDDAGNVVETLSPITTNYASHKVSLEAGKVYTFTVEPIRNANSAKTGFAVITADGCADTYHTQQLGVDAAAPGGETAQVTFTLQVEEDTNVYVRAHWGTSVYYVDYRDAGNVDDCYVTAGASVLLTAATSETSSDPSEEESTTTTVTNATTTVTATEETAVTTTTMVEETTTTTQVETSDPTTTVETTTTTISPVEEQE